jgi:hypothetical protein
MSIEPTTEFSQRPPASLNTETAQPVDAKTLAAESMRRLFRLPTRDPIAAKPDEHESLRTQLESNLTKANTEGFTDEDIRILAIRQETQQAQQAHMELTRLNITTNNFQIGSATQEQYQRKNEMKKQIDEAVRFGASRKEIETPGQAHLASMQENEQQKLLEAAQEAYLELVKLQTETRNLPLGEIPVEKQAQMEEYRQVVGKAKQKGIPAKEIEDKGNQYMDEETKKERENAIVNAKAAQIELETLSKATQNFQIGSMSIDQQSRRAKLENIVREARLRWLLTGDELVIARSTE